MPSFPRAELDEMVRRWLKENERCEQAGDWRPLAEMYTEDATYGWHVGPREEFMAIGREEIRELALGQEMEGLEGWTYPYQSFLIDDRQGEVIDTVQSYIGLRSVRAEGDHLLLNGRPIRLRMALDQAHRHIEIVGVQVLHLGLGNLAHLRFGNRTGEGPARCSRPRSRGRPTAARRRGPRRRRSRTGRRPPPPSPASPRRADWRWSPPAGRPCGTAAGRFRRPGTAAPRCRRR